MAVLQAGADVLEIGIPFSDPLLDGPAIQRSQQIALEAGTTPGWCLEAADQLRRRTEKPLLFMGSYNPILAYDVGPFCRAAADAGVSGLVIPDLPIEEQDELRTAAEKDGLHLIQLVAPTTTPDRLRRVCAAASGFVYCISVTGVTGARREVAGTAKPLVERVKACTGVPVAVGFGIATPGQAREVTRFADGVIVGSALIKLISGVDPGRRTAAAASFVASLRGAMSEMGAHDSAESV